MTGDEGVEAEEQQRLLQSIHAMIAELEAEKRSYLGILDSSQVCCCLLPYYSVHPWLDGEPGVEGGGVKSASGEGNGEGKQACQCWLVVSSWFQRPLLDCSCMSVCMWMKQTHS